jgi:hypothetical protein
MARFCHKLHQPRSKFEKMESQTFQQFLDNIKPKGVNRITNIAQGHISPYTRCRYINIISTNDCPILYNRFILSNCVTLTITSVKTTTEVIDIYVCMFNKQRCMLSILFDQIRNCVCIFIIVWQNILIHRRPCKCFVCNKLRKPFFSFKENYLIIYIVYSNYG